MRILHVYRTYYPDSQGGIQEAIRQICLSTQAYGAESRIYTLSSNPKPQNLTFAEGLVQRSCSWMAPASCDIGDLNSIVEYRKLIAWADVIHYHFPWPFLDILHLFNLSKKPAVLTYHSDIIKQKLLKKFYNPLMHLTLRKMFAIIATSPNYLESSPVLQKLLPKRQVEVIPLGIARPQISQVALSEAEPLFFDQHGIQSGEYLLFLGVLRYYKGVHSLIQAGQSIKGKIVIAGDGPESKTLKKLAKLYQLKNVIFLGEVNDRQKYLLLAHCTALVLPAHLRSEAFGMVLIEASMHAKPMISCEVGSGTSYVNTHQVTGLVVPPEDPAALSEACNQLLHNKALATKMGLAALQRYEAIFSGSALGKAHIALYFKALAFKPN